MQLSVQWNFDESFYIGVFILLIILSFSFKKYYLMKHRPLFSEFSMHIDRFMIVCYSIYIIYLLYTSSSNNCEYFYDCYEGSNNTLLSNSYSIDIDGECPPLSIFVDLYSDSHRNGRNVPPLKPHKYSTCPDSPYDCCYFPTHCDSCIRGDLSGDYTYSRYLRAPETIFADGIHPHFGKVNTKITQMDAEGTNCPELNDLLLYYLIDKRRNTFFNFIWMIIVYLIIIIIIYCYDKSMYPNYHKSSLYPGYGKSPDWDRAIARGHANQFESDRDEENSEKTSMTLKASA